jgi:hypothetical protein
MALRDAIRALSELWDDVEQQLCPEDRRPLFVAMRSLVQDPDDEDLMFEVVARLHDVLPRDHDILAAVAIEDTRSSTTTSVAWMEVIERIHDILVEASP